MKILSLRFVVKVKISVFRLESWVFSRTIRRYVLIEFAQISVLLQIQSLENETPIVTS